MNGAGQAIYDILSRKRRHPGEVRVCEQTQLFVDVGHHVLARALVTGTHFHEASVIAGSPVAECSD